MLGTQIGQYRIVEQIGEGGMGAVYRGEHVMLGRSVAVKVLHPEFGMRPEIVTRFFNEARAATQVSDPGIVQIFDFGYHTDNRAYIVMELLIGEPLDQRLRRVGMMPINDALRIMRQVASSLGAAHARGIIHRDLKPENIFICRDGEVLGGERAKILDFGIAKLTHDTAGPKTNTAAILGTPTYMSPEQCRGAGQIDQRSDIYSLGCVLAKLLTGSAPFDAEGTGDLIVMHINQQPQAPSLRARNIPPEVDALVLRCLEKDPVRRYNSGTDLAGAIDQLLSRGSYPMLPQPHGPSTMYAASVPTTLSSASGVNTRPATGSRRVGWIAGGLVVAGAVAATVVVATSHHDLPITPVVMAPVVATPVPAPDAAVIIAPDKRSDAIVLISATITKFTTWTKDHPHDACPPATAIASSADPWGTPLALTCTDQPGDQIAGVSSAGPDRTFGTADDLRSWELGATVSELAHGPRWAPIATPVPHGKPVIKTKPQDTGFVDLDGDGIPDKR